MEAKVLILSKNEQYHHDFEYLGKRIVEWSKELEDVETEVSHEREILTSGELDNFDLCVLCTTMTAPLQELTDEQEGAVVDFVDKGKGLFGIHAATAVDEKNTKYIDLIGARVTHHPPYHEFQVKIEDKEHPVTGGIEDFRISDELYVLDREPEGVHILATAFWEDKAQPMVYVKSYGKGKVLYIALGHDRAAFDNPAFKELVINGIKWALE